MSSIERSNLCDLATKHDLQRLKLQIEMQSAENRFWLFLFTTFTFVVLLVLPPKKPRPDPAVSGRTPDVRTACPSLI